MLVSCSIDNRVIVWRLPAADGQEGRPSSSTSTAKILNPFQTLEQHTSFVKVRGSCVLRVRSGCRAPRSRV